MYCSANNGVVLPMQEIDLLLHGPKDKKWFVSFSVNNSPAMVLNGRAGIDFSRFNLSLFFRNTSDHVKNYTIVLKKAWLADLTPIYIPEDEKTATIQILPLASPEVDDYYPKAKINSTQKYSAKLGKNSTYSVWVPEGASVLKNESEIINNKQEIDVKIKWPKEATTNYFKLIETDAFGCNSDTIFAGMEVVKSFTVDLGGNKNLCKGESITLVPEIDLPSEYSYQWNTGETTKEITVNIAGTYYLTVTDLSDNQKVKTNIEVIEQEAPIIPIDDYLVVDDENPHIEIYEEGYSYTWPDGSSDSKFKITETGTYSVTVESQFGCSSTKSFVAKLKSELFKIELPTVIHMCGNEKMNLNPKLSIDQEYNFEWSNASTGSSIYIEEDGDYWVKITDPDGFQKTATTKVLYHPNPIIDLGEDITLWDKDTTILNAENTGSDFIWNTGETTQTIKASSGGVFVVEVSDEFGCSNKDTLFVNHRKGENFGVFLGEDQSICSGDSVFVNPMLEGNPAHPLEYNWLGLANTESEIYLKDKGHYCLEITDANGYTESDCIEINLLETPEVNLGQDLVSQPGKKIVLDAGTPNCFYQWSTGEITQKININSEGQYWVQLTTESNCTVTDTLEVSYLEDYPFVGLPKAFSPNGDTHNDELFVRGQNVKEITLVIYNRLGHKLFETKDINKGWDGFFRGQLQDMDVYVYVMEVTFLDGKQIRKKGNVALLR